MIRRARSLGSQALIVCGALFIPFLFFAPLIGMVPPQATAAALIIVGYLMVSALTEAEDEAEIEEGIAPRTSGKLAGIVGRLGGVRPLLPGAAAPGSHQLDL